MFLWELFSFSDVTEGFLLFQENSQWRVKGGRGMLVFDAWAAESSFLFHWCFNCKCVLNMKRMKSGTSYWIMSSVTVFSGDVTISFFTHQTNKYFVFWSLCFKSWDPHKERNSTTLERKVYLHENENQHYRPSKNYTCYKMWCFCLFYNQHSEVKNQKFVTVCGGRSAFVHK